jgi:alkylation response protein AidB-like acyl-CoA dehydrogenase
MSQPLIQWNDEQAMLADAAWSFVRARFPMETVRRLLESPDGFERATWQEMGAMGWLGIALPEAYGGSDLGLGSLACIMEAMGQHLGATPFLPSTLAMQAILAAGSETQRQALLPDLASGQRIATVAFTEPHGSWELRQLETVATMGKDGYVLHGTKRFALDYAAADVVVISAQCQDKPALFAVPKAALGEAAHRREIITDETRRCYELKLDGVHIESDSRLLGGDIDQAIRHLELAGAFLMAADLVGAANGAFELTLDYAKTRKQFGHPIGSYQAIKHPLVDAMVGIELGRSLVYHAATTLAATEDKQAAIAVRMAKAHANDVMAFMADRAVQFHGGMGFTYDCHASLYYRHSMWGRHTFGDAIHHRRHLAALML